MCSGASTRPSARARDRRAYPSAKQRIESVPWRKPSVDPPLSQHRRRRSRPVAAARGEQHDRHTRERLDARRRGELTAHACRYLDRDGLSRTDHHRAGKRGGRPCIRALNTRLRCADYPLRMSEQQTADLPTRGRGHPACLAFAADRNAACSPSRPREAAARSEPLTTSHLRACRCLPGRRARARRRSRRSRRRYVWRTPRAMG